MNGQHLPAWIRHSARIDRLDGSVIHAPLQSAFVGERCVVVCPHSQQPVCEAQVICFTPAGTRLSLLGTASGLPRNAWVVPLGQGAHVMVDGETPGAVLDGAGQTIARLAECRAPRGAPVRLDIDQPPPSLVDRRRSSGVFETGLRAIDGLLTCAVGQRMGIFASAGAGKTTLVSSLIAHAHADITVVGLVGERGREAADFIEHGIPAASRNKTILVCSTSDRPPAERRNAAHIATALAEHYRDAGKRVLLLIDSVTRYARALRDVALSAGEVPARRGYPPSVFEALPRLLERAGATDKGSITAFYTVLLEDEEQADPIGEEVRSILDGHIHLSRRLAERAYFPAIDVLKSASRVMPQVAQADHVAAAAALRAKLGKLAELELPRQLGEYRLGEDAEVDALIEAQPVIEQWLRQAAAERSSHANTVRGLHALA